MVRDDNVVTGGCSIQDNLLVAVYTGPSISPKYLVMLRHAERLHGLAVLGFHTFNLQSVPIRNSNLILFPFLSLFLFLFLLVIHFYARFFFITNELEYDLQIAI